MKLTNSCLLLISLVFYTVQAAPTASKSPGAPEKKFTVPVHKNPNHVPNARNQVQKISRKYSKLINSNATGEVPLIDFYSDTLYSGVVYVGTPPKPFLVDFDTGSSDFWIGSSLCSSCSQHTYNPLESSTFVPDGQLWIAGYGDNSTSGGFIVHDTADIGGISLTNLSIYAATVISKAFNDPSNDGLLGLAFDSLATNPGIKTPFQEMVDRNLVSSPVFSVHFGKAIDGGSLGGEYIFGGYDPSYIDGDLTTVPVDNSHGYWGIETGRIGVKNTSFGNKTNSAIVDTGTTLLVFPKSMALEIAKYYDATDAGDGTFIITCDENELEPLEFDIEGTTFAVPPDSLIYQRDGDKCAAGFTYNSGIDDIILGDVFIKNYYIIFDIEAPQIQIAPVKIN